ncbi:CRISPR-associated protein Csy2 [Rubripirellula obstinata]|uniref:CRISPR-associated protein Csy2 n=1 Tax=Rubripirellula obstinata TaxID=406547 RepID=A0A5B1CJS6_9BACT|nr:type I-F CRISPR-associated protein Csy2 [Rubripirellula obstinata]KAA1260531.1 CRISPR-associated protein Csy2 [Rubripirellula obstinata]
MSQYLVIRRLQVRGANALSSPLTFGFPAVTAFLGFGHALQRHFNGGGPSGDFQIDGVGIVSHQFEMLDHQAGYSRTLQLTANPLNEKGQRSSFIEEGRCHMTVSLVLEVRGLTRGQRDADRLGDILFARMKLAGGDLLVKPKLEFISDDRRSIRSLMPGYALMDRRDWMIEAVQGGDDAMMALHRHLRVQHRSTIAEDGKVSWSSQRHRLGWVVPIATGFHAINPVGPAAQARDASTPHRFAESIVTLGEFVMATRIQRLSELIWRYHHDGDIYACVQNSSSPSVPVIN